MEKSNPLPCESPRTPLFSPDQQMSAALKARLRKCGRWYATNASPLPKAPASQTPEEVFQRNELKASKSPTIAANINQNIPVSGMHSLTPKSSTTRMHPYSTPRSANFRKRLGGFTSPRFVKKPGKGSDDSSTVSINKMPSDEAALANRIGEKPKMITAEYVDKTDSQCNVTTSGSLRKDCSKSELRDLIKDKQEILRKLNLVKMYRKKNNLSELQDLIDKWRGVTQKAIEELSEISPEPKPSVEQILDYFQIDHSLVKFDLKEKSFKS